MSELEDRLQLSCQRPVASTADFEPKEGDFFHADVNLVSTNTEPRSDEPVEHETNVVHVSLHVTICGCQHVIDEGHSNTRRQPTKNSIDDAHERTWRACESHGHPVVCELTPRCPEGRLLNAAVGSVQLHLMKTHKKIARGEELGLAQGRKRRIDVGKWIGVSLGILVQLTPVDDNAVPPSSLWDEHRLRAIRADHRLDEPQLELLIDGLS